jgi:two-component system CitB family sensor kinase/two-component system sensor histidine kinase DcuS
MTIAGRTMIVNLIPLPGNAQGAVASFRPKDELDRLSRELTRMQEYSEMLRAQTHEHSNKLHTIAGLIQIGAHQEALELVMTEASGYQDLIRSLTEAVPDPLLAGIILGKFNRARELKINFALDPGSSLADIPPHLNREHLVTILGNLLDNAFEAVREFAGEKKVRLFLTDLGTDLIVEVEDSGPGVAEEVAQSLFDKGVTTKGRLDRGMGLYLVRQALDALGGEITFARSALGGALFTAIVPKNRQQEKREDK